jgi:hypothetical protein
LNRIFKTPNHQINKMTFEEFFRKKRIDLVALQKGDAALFSEFKIHFEQMGEKSFDHTKKYWFNKLRHIYLLPVEAKTEKVKIDNPLAEQTITESLIDSAPTPNLGFVPKFSASIPKTDAATDGLVKVEEQSEEKEIFPLAETKTAPKPGFTPRFKAANLPKSVVENKEVPLANIPVDDASPALPNETPAPKAAYKPRFNIKNIPPKKEEDN